MRFHASVRSFQTLVYLIEPLSFWLIMTWGTEAGLLTSKDPEKQGRPRYAWGWIESFFPLQRIALFYNSLKGVSETALKKRVPMLSRGMLTQRKRSINRWWQRTFTYSNRWERWVRSEGSTWRKVRQIWLLWWRVGESPISKALLP
jgi:hypothetical protein